MRRLNEKFNRLENLVAKHKENLDEKTLQAVQKERQRYEALKADHASLQEKSGRK